MARILVAQQSFNLPEGSACPNGFDSPTFRYFFGILLAAAKNNSRAQAEVLPSVALSKILRSSPVRRIPNSSDFRSLGALRPSAFIFHKKYYGNINNSCKGINNFIVAAINTGLGFVNPIKNPVRRQSDRGIHNQALLHVDFSARCRAMACGAFTGGLNVARFFPCGAVGIGKFRHALYFAPT